MFTHLIIFTHMGTRCVYLATDVYLAAAGSIEADCTIVGDSQEGACSATHSDGSPLIERQSFPRYLTRVIDLSTGFPVA